MNFNDYQTKSRRTAGYPAIGHPIIYPTLGLVNEAGEVAGKIKKVFRDKEGQISEETREAIKAELGDVLWYIAQIATELIYRLLTLPNRILPSYMTDWKEARSEEKGIIDNQMSLRDPAG